VQHALPGATGGNSSTNYTVNTPGHAHALTSTTTTGPGAGTSSYGYDALGQTTTRTLPTGGQSLTWTPEHRIDAVKDASGTVLSSYRYDADGNQLIRHDPVANLTTLYLPGEELTYNTSTGARNGIRYYTFNGALIAERTNALNPVWLDADPHSTAQVAYDPVSDTVVSRRQFDPYGNEVGAGIGTWPGADTHTFLNKPTDASTGLTDVGARTYDPVTGRFMSVDPVLDPGDPQQDNGYAYSDNNPVTKTDPTGLDPAGKCNAWDNRRCTKGSKYYTDPTSPPSGGGSSVTVPVAAGTNWTTPHNRARTAAIDALVAQGWDPGSFVEFMKVTGAKKKCMTPRGEGFDCSYGVPDIAFVQGGITWVWEVKAAGQQGSAVREAQWYVDRINDDPDSHAVLGLPFGLSFYDGGHSVVAGLVPGAAIYGPVGQVPVRRPDPVPVATPQTAPQPTGAPVGPASIPVPRLNPVSTPENPGNYGKPRAGGDWSIPGWLKPALGGLAAGASAVGVAVNVVTCPVTDPAAC
jgi:RHS repeat-associated protein